MVTFFIVLGSGPYTVERPYTTLRFIYTALLDGNKVKFFCFEDAIYVLKKNQQPANVYNIEEWVKKCMAEPNFEAASCGVCMKARGMDASELMPGVKTGTMELAVAWAKESDKQLFF